MAVFIVAGRRYSRALEVLRAEAATDLPARGLAVRAGVALVGACALPAIRSVPLQAITRSPNLRRLPNRSKPNATSGGTGSGRARRSAAPAARASSGRLVQHGQQ